MRATPSIQLVYARAGVLVTTMGGRTFDVEPGQFVLLDNTRFYQMEMRTEHECIDLMMPQGWLERYLPDPTALLGRPISATSGWGAPLGALLETILAGGLAEAPLPSASPQDWSLKDRARASWHPGRSGDVVLLLDRAVTPIPVAMPGAYVATHGSAFDYDRRVPILFWRRGLAGFEQPAPVETVDIAPSLAALLHVPVPASSFDGRCLDLDGGVGNTCN